MFEEQVGWAVDAGVDYIIGETFSYAAEALIALDVIKRAKQTAVITLAMHQADVTRENWSVADACKRLADAGADVVGLNCIRGPATMMPLLRQMRGAVKTHDGGASRSLPHQRKRAVVSVAVRHALALRRRHAAVPGRARSLHLQSLSRSREFGSEALDAGHPLPRRVLRRRPASHPRARGSRRQASAGEQVFRGHVEARVPGLARAHQAGPEGLRWKALKRFIGRRSIAGSRHREQSLLQ